MRARTFGTALRTAAGAAVFVALAALAVTGIALASGASPNADAGGPYAIAEGADLSLDASLSTDPESDPLSYAWDLDNDGSFDDATGISPVVPWATLVALGIDDDGGPFTIGVRAYDGSTTDTDTANLTISNTEPTITVTGSGVAAPGEPYDVLVVADDPGDDTITSWTIAWGDGSVDTFAGAPGVASHPYSVTGLTNNIVVSVTDEDGTWIEGDAVVAFNDAVDKIGRYDAESGTKITNLAASGSLDSAFGSVVGPDGLIYVTGGSSDTVERYDPQDNSHVGTFVTAGSGGLDQPTGLAFGPDGDLYVISEDDGDVLQYDGATGAFSGVFATGLDGPRGMLFAPDGNLYVADDGTDTIEEFDGGTGATLGTFATLAAGSEPNALTMGPDGNFYVSLFQAGEVDEVDGTTGAVLGTFISGLSNPMGLRFGPDGELWVSEYWLERVGRYDGTTGASLGVRITEPTPAGPASLTFVPDHQVIVVPPLDVNSLGNSSDNNQGDGVCFTGGLNSMSQPECTLRAAVQEANASGGIDLVTFDIPDGLTSGEHRISSSGLPTITEVIAIDGTTEPDHLGTPVVVLDGNGAGGDGFRLNSNSDGSTIRGMIVRDWGGDGIEIQAGSTGNTISENYIGSLNAAGTDAGVGERNIGYGIRVLGGSNTIGGPIVSSANVISGNSGGSNGGIFVNGALATNNVIQYNKIGTDATGATAVPNNLHGIRIQDASDTDVLNNVISGNNVHGVYVFSGGSTGTEILRNNIGANLAMTATLGNGFDGIRLEGGSSGTVVGSPGNGNILAGNSQHGLNINSSDDNLVQGNSIGTNLPGALDLGNNWTGVHVDPFGSSDNLIGGETIAASNQIAYNRDGIVLLSGDDNSIVGNSIWANDQLGIDIDDDGVTGNDGGDGDSGANDLLNFPVITTASESGGIVSIDFDLDAPTGKYRIEFFTNPSGTDPSGNGEGETFADSIDVVHNGTGVESFSHVFPGADGDELTATATEVGAVLGSTSEFSTDFTVLDGGCADSDGDGLCDLEEDANTDLDSNPATNPGPDTDGDANANYLDSDDDDDSTPTAAENADPNGDGDPRDALDTDRDGQPDYLDLPTGASAGTVASEQKISDTTGGLGAVLNDSDAFGRSAAGIGDLDRDGVNDVVVGTTGDDDGGTDRGAVYVLFLNSDGTVKAEQKISDTTGGLTATLDDTDLLGASVEGLGDLDGDGNPDIAVGVQGDDDGGTDRGAVYILFMNSDGTVKAEQKISDTTGGLTTTLDDADLFGYGIAQIGDLDGDGLNDIAVAANADDDGGSARGAVYILFLNSDGTVKAEQKISDTAGGLTATLDDADLFGASVAGLGDLDGDGNPDIVVGAQGDDDGGSARGAAYILFLDTDGTVKAEQKISDTAGGLTATIDNGDFIGYAVAGTGDMNGDGVVDAVVSAVGDDDGGNSRGAIHVLFLDTDGTVQAEQKISSTQGGLVGPLLDNNLFGYSLASVGDLDEDGAIDIMVGELGDDGGTDRGAVRVLKLAAPCGNSDGDGLCDLNEDANTDLDSNPATNPGPDTDGDTTPNYLDSDDDGDSTPTASENADPNADGDPRDARDTDRDGEPDYLDAPTVQSGATVATEQKISETAGGLTATLTTNDHFGRSVASIGDIDGDGIVDIAVGAHQDDDGSSDRGAVYILFLNAAGTVKAEQKISDTAGGFTAVLDNSDEFGIGVAGLGDLDGDLIPDIVVGAHQDDDGGGNHGAVYVLFLNSDGTVKSEQKISDTAGGFAATLDANDRFGTSVTNLGDVDGDGLNDIAVGASWDDDGGADRGAVYVLFLNADGTVKAEQKISSTAGGLTGPLVTNDQFGIGVAGLGDLDGDGVEDLAVGAFRDDDGGTDRGAVYVLLLNASGTVKAEQVISDTQGGFATTLDNNDHFGRAVGALGDVDADGVVDLAVGTPGDDDGNSLSGAAYVLLLNSNGSVKAEQKISNLEGSLAVTLDTSDQFGYSLAGAGDVDGDGAIGFVAGAYGDDDGGPADRGAVYVLDLSAGQTISGTVFEDVVGDALNDGVVGDANNPGAVGVDVYLYLDDGDSNLDGGDTLVGASPIQTDGSGNYSFPSLPDATYHVVVDSKTVPSSQDPGATQGELWAEQTWGPIGGYCDNGFSFQIRIAAGPCYAGITDSISDDFSQWDDHEHRSILTVSGADIPDVDFGFSFNVVTTMNGGDIRDDDTGAARTVQGSLRQFIQNANEISGPNEMRLVPASSAGVGGVWRISVSNALPAITDDATTIDGTSYSHTDGSTILDTNAGFLGTNAGGGATVGTDAIALPQVAAPEFELRGSGITEAGFEIRADDATVRRLAMYGFGDTGENLTDGDIEVPAGSSVGGLLVEETVIGTLATAFADPGAGNRSGGSGVAIEGGTGALSTIRNSLFGWTDELGVSIIGSNSIVVTANEVRSVGQGGNIFIDALSAENGSAAVQFTNNLIDDAPGNGVSTWQATGANSVANNTITNVGTGGPQTAGVFVFGGVSTVEKNIITGVAGNGVTVVGQNPAGGPFSWSASIGNRISQNNFGGNGGLAIDLTESSDTESDHEQGDGVTLTPGTLATTGNTGLDSPVITSVTVGTVDGTTCASCEVEVYRAVAGAGDTHLGNDYGEGVAYLGTTTANGSGDWSLTGITGLAGGDEVSAITIDGSANTSEFAANVMVGLLQVNSTGDSADADTGDGQCDTGATNSQGATECTLRAAIEQANALAGPDDITFDIPATEAGYTAAPLAYRIEPSSSLPDVTGIVDIDGTTQPDFGGSPIIELNGGSTTGDGLTISGGSSTIAGLVINEFGIGMVIDTNGNNVIEGNYIGTTVTGTTALANTSAGIRVETADNVIGGFTIPQRNVISGNGSHGVWIVGPTATNNIVRGNYLGVDSGGATDLGSAGGSGVVIALAPDNTIGGTLPGAGNVISGNAQHGIMIGPAGADDTKIQGNHIGTNAAGTAGIPNTGDGINIFGGATGTAVGGPTPGERNVISGNLTSGIDISGATTTGNDVLGNYIGTNAAGTGPVGNIVGVLVSAPMNTIGGSIPGAGNVISGNLANGVMLQTADANNNSVAGNLIGTNASGSGPVANSAAGVRVDLGAHDNTIGGTLTDEINVISGNGTSGVILDGSGTTANVISGNLIGTDAAGTGFLQNDTNGIWIGSGAAGNTVGGTAAGATNLISGNGEDGIEIDDAGSTAILGNVIGLDAAVDGPIPNGEQGIQMLNDTSATQIGGIVANSGNIISGGDGEGISIGGLSTGTMIRGNYIGTDITGLLARPNDSNGILLDARDITIGGNSPAARNVISGNTGDGIALATLADDAIIQGNYIGVGSDGSTPLGNGATGVAVSFGSRGHLVGGDGAGDGNTIANNTEDGIGVIGGLSTDNSFLGNAIFANGELGIDLLLDEVTANDAGDGDSGSNDLLNFPVITSATSSAGTIDADYDLDVPAGNYRIEFFSNPSGADVSGNGEGEIFESAHTISHTGSGVESFSHSFAGGLGEIITAVTVEEQPGPVYRSTSEFSAAVTTTGANSPPTADAGGPYVLAEGGSLDLDGSGSTDPDTDPLTYAWDLDNDLVYDDATGVSPSEIWATLVGLGFDDDGGPFTIGLQVDDSNGGVDTDTATFSITNTPPTLTVTGSGSTLPGRNYTVTLGESDPGNETVTSWTIDWGDGTIDSIPGNPTSASHTYTRAGPFNVAAAVVDEDGTFLDGDMQIADFWGDGAEEYDGNTGLQIREFPSNPAIAGPGDMMVGTDGLTYVVGFTSDNVVRYDSTTGIFVDTFVAAGAGGLNGAGGMEWTPEGDLLVTSYNDHSVKRFDGNDGSYLGDFVTSGSGGLSGPVDIVFRDDGHLFVTGWLSGSVHHYDVDGSSLGVFASGLTQTAGLDFGPDGDLYVANHAGAGGTVEQYDGTSGAPLGSLLTIDNPFGVTWGPDGNLWVASETSDLVNVYTSTGVLIRTHSAAGDGLSGPWMIDFVPDHQVAVAGLSVNSTGDSADASAGDGACDTGGTNTAGDAECTLRAAIEEANALIGADGIGFDVPATEPGHSGGVWTISPTSQLPVVTDTVVLDASTQPGWASTPVIELDGIGAGAFADGFRITGDSVEIRGFAITRFPSDGIEVNSSASDALIAGNHIGVDAAGSTDRGNTGRGIDLQTGSGPTTVGGTVLADRNVISGNGGDAIIVWNSDDNVIIGNFVGTDVGGLVAIPNDADGVVLGNGSSGNTIGQPGSGNVLSGNGQDGIEIDDVTGPNTIQANLIGLGVDGTTPIANGRYGIVLYNGANNTQIGGSLAERNVISANIDDGIYIDGNSNAATTGNVIEGNLIGTDVFGVQDRGNGRYGVRVNNGAPGNIVGTVGAGNTISGNGEDGIWVSTPGTDGTIIRANRLGTTVLGDAAIPNDDRGIQIESGATNTIVGGSAPGEGNVISGNSGDGMIVADFLSLGTTGTIIEGNLIGVQSDGTTPLGNGQHGVHLTDTTGNRVGGTAIGAGNTIANNASLGIRVSPTTGTNSLLGNLIYTNGSLGIDLSDDGVTLNDPGDGDSGPNDLLNFPEINSATLVGPIVSVSGTFDVPAGDYRFEFFRNPSGDDPTGYGEGEIFAGTATLSHSGAGPQPFGAAFPGAMGDFITATLTEELPGPTHGATSEFSAAEQVVGPLFVNSTGDAGDPSPANGVCDTGALNSAGSPECTLRAAIETANASSKLDTIVFELPDTEPGYQNLGAGNSYWTIQPATSLPVIVGNDTSIDGSTQATYASAQGYFWNAFGPSVELDGSVVGSGRGLEISADDTVLRDLVVNRFSTGIAITGGDNNVIAGNYVGPDASGAVGEVGNDTQGIFVQAATNTVIGGTTAADRNIISGNRQRGVFIDDFSDGPPAVSDGTLVIGNYIGTNAAGSAALPYDGGGAIQQMGIALWDGPDNFFGGASAGEGNVISGNSWHGIYIWGPNANSNHILGNIIGLDATASTAIGNGSDNPANRSGILLTSAPGNIIGGTNPGEGNIVAGNDATGIAITNTGSGSVLGNDVYDNVGLGIDLALDGPTANDSGDGDTGPNDLLNHPVVTGGDESGGTVTVDFDLDAPAGDYRVELFRNPDRADPSGYGEGEIYEASTTITHTGSGVEPFQITYSGTGTETIALTATEEFTGPVYGVTSEFSAAAAAGGLLVNSTSDGGDIVVGDDVCDTGALNSAGDVECTLRAALEEANASTVVDTVAFDIPVADPGHTAGVWRFSPAAALPAISRTVELDARTQPGYSGSPIVEVDGLPMVAAVPGFVITPAAPGSTVAGFALTNIPGAGVITLGDSATIIDNYIGVDPDGVTGAGGGAEGISVATTASGVVIDSNLIGGHSLPAIVLTGDSDGTTITGNLIGTDVSLTVDLGNAHGIWADTTGSAVIGGTGAGDGNTIRNSTVDAIELNNSGPGISVLGNSVASNAGHGIDLEGDGPTANDPGDGDTGANDLLNYPEIVNVRRVAGDLIVDFTLDAPAGDYRIELFGNSVGDGSGFGEGETLFGSGTITHTGSGAESFTVSGTSAATIVTTTATEDLGAGAFGASSEFSAAVPSPDLVVVNSTGDSPDATSGDGECDTGATNSGGDPECTLRAALAEVNDPASPVDTVWFDMPATEPGHAAGVWTIAPGSPLPPVSITATIDGSTQPGHVENTTAAPSGLDGTQTILIDGSGAGPATGLTLAADGTSLRGVVVSGFSGNGIVLTGDSIIVADVYVGADAAGAAAMPNTNHGILVSGDGDMVGGPAPRDRVLVSGNGLQGIAVNGSSVQVLGTVIGVDSTATAAMPNGGDAIRLAGTTDAVVGQVGAGNILSGNSGAGLSTIGGSGHVISANAIGTNQSGSPLGNSGAGIAISSSTNVVVGGSTPLPGNTIAHNGGDALDITGASTTAAVIGNSMHSNGGLGIDLAADGPTPNDPGDGDTGANGLLNTPVLGTASVSGGLVTIDYTLDVPAGTYRLEFFVNGAGADPSGFGEGGALVTFSSHVHGGAGAESGVVGFPGSVGDIITATATPDLGAGTFGGSSEFSGTVTASVAALSQVTDHSVRRSDVGAAGGLDPSSDAVASAAGAALSFDGIDDRLIGPALDVVDANLSIAAWVNPSSLVGQPRVVSKLDGVGNPIYELLVDSGTGEAVAHLRIGGSTVTARGGSIAVGSSQHLASSWDGTELVLYVDSIEVDRVAAVGSLATDVATDVILGNNSMSTQPFDGLIDDVRIDHGGIDAAALSAAFSTVDDPSFVQVGDQQTSTPGSWTATGAQSRSGSFAIAAPETSGPDAAAWAVATGIDEPGLVFESWWWLSTDSAIDLASGTRAGPAPTDEYEAALLSPSGWELRQRSGTSQVVDAAAAGTPSTGTWVEVELWTDQLGDTRLFIGGAEVTGWTSQGSTLTSGSAALRAGALPTGETWYVDDARGRKLVTPEPVTSLGPLDRN